MRNAHWAILGLLVFLSLSCADGVDKGGAGMGGTNPCGDGMVDNAKGETCETQMVAGVLQPIPTAMPTCMEMNMGTRGVVMCNQCQWDFSMCMPGSGGMGGIGGSGMMNSLGGVGGGN